MNVVLWLVGITSMIEGVVLDPALYLAPSPPLTTSSDNDAVQLWSQTMKSRMKDEGDAASLSIENSETIMSSKPEVMDESETFWPSYRSTSLRGIHFPIGFHLSGTYGGSSGSGVYGSSYMARPGSYSDQGKVFAGTNYKTFEGHHDLRTYSSDSRPSWGGWGNGRWGHYGKG